MVADHTFLGFVQPQPLNETQIEMHQEIACFTMGGDDYVGNIYCEMLRTTAEAQSALGDLGPHEGPFPAR